MPHVPQLLEVCVSMKTAKHPALPFEITFDEPTHTYTDNEKTVYTSVTTFSASYFPKFDAKAAAARIAARDNRLEMDILAEWDAKRDAAGIYGTRVHEYAEAIIDGTTPHKPETDRERSAFRCVDKALVSLAKLYEFLGTEKIVFDPLYALSGTIDLPARNKKTGALAILDWKTCETISGDNWGRMALPPIAHFLDSKQVKYQMQLSSYAWLLTAGGSGYFPEDTPVETALIHIPHHETDPVWMPFGYEPEAVRAMVYDHQDRRLSDHLTETQNQGIREKSEGLT